VHSAWEANEKTAHNKKMGRGGGRIKREKKWIQGKGEGGAFRGNDKEKWRRVAGKKRQGKNP